MLSPYTTAWIYGLAIVIGRRVAGFDWHLWEPGDYGFWADAEHWAAIAPTGDAANLGSYKVTEHEDGTITVEPSIAVSTSRGGQKIQVYHGYLERGVWRPA